jgi:two-component system sensor histidine kinase MprB
VFAFRKTLRYRLTLAFLLWTAGIQIAVAAVFVLGRELLVVDGIDRALTDTAVRLRRSLEADTSWPPALEQASFELQSQPNAPLLPLVLRARSVQGDTIARWPDREPMLEITAPLSTGAPEHLVFATQRLQAPSDEDDTVGPVRFRSATMTISTNEGISYQLDFGASLELADRFTSVMGRILASGLLVGIIGAGIAGWIVAGRATRRIERVTREVEHVSPTRLDEPRELPTPLTGDDEIGRMGAAVDAMLKRLASAFRSQEYFISNVSHELKTPIASLLAEAQVIRKGQARAEENAAAGTDNAAQADPAHLLKFTHSVEDEMRRLGGLVETFLAMARFGEGKSGRSESLVSINDTALDSVKHNSLYAQQQGVPVRLNLADLDESHTHDHAEPVVRGDGHLLRVAIDNLIRNAIGVSERGQVVDIGVSMNDHTVSVEVSDRGPGVPAGFIDRMFDRFAQRADRAVGYRGTGLGLNIAKNIVELHGGRIEVANRSAPDAGAVFTIRFPMARTTDAAASESGSSPPD